MLFLREVPGVLDGGGREVRDACLLEALRVGRDVATFGVAAEVEDGRVGRLGVRGVVPMGC